DLDGGREVLVDAEHAEDEHQGEAAGDGERLLPRRVPPPAIAPARAGVTARPPWAARATGPARARRAARPAGATRASRHARATRTVSAGAARPWPARARGPAWAGRGAEAPRVHRACLARGRCDAGRVE